MPLAAERGVGRLDTGAMKMIAELFTRDVNLVIVGAILGAVLSVAATFAYDLFKDARQAQEARRTVLRALSAELASNLEILRYNEQLLVDSLKALQDGKRIVIPLAQLHVGG
jgi:hypothetical protein